MWPFDLIKKRTRHRRLNAALVVLLGHYLFERFDPSLRRRIDAEVDAEIRRIPEVPAALRPNWGWADLAVERALAMARLGIEPGLGSLEWNILLQPWPKMVLSWCDMRPSQVSLDYRPMDPMTQKAKALLQSLGLPVTEDDPWNAADLSELGNVGGTANAKRQVSVMPSNLSSSGREEA